MAQTWPHKAPTEVVERRWTVPVDSDDGLASFTSTATGITVVSSATEGDDAVYKLSGGTAATTGSVTITATTSRGRTLVETFYIPIFASTANIAETANDFCSFALRKIIGNGATAAADELSDAMERLNDMLAAWKAQGADVGTIVPVLSTTTLTIPDAFVQGVKYNLRLHCHEHYGVPLSQYDIEMAKRGLQLIKSTLLSDDRGAAVYH